VKPRGINSVPSYNFTAGDKVKIREGWDQEDREGVVLGDPVWVSQPWVPVKWDEEPIPVLFQEAGLVHSRI